ncbi:MAG: sulfatase family protein [Planctomycetota bacterium]
MWRLIVLVLVGWMTLSATAEKRPNIVFLFADDQRNDVFGHTGHPIVKTPNLDRLAGEGVRFENAFVSHSICWVSRTTILSGLTARSFGEKKNPDQAKPEAVEKLYTDLLMEVGYRTAHFGKWHAKMPRGYKPEDHFSVFKPIGRNPYFKEMPDGSLRHETQLIGDEAIKFLAEQKKDQPFAINLWFNATHAEDRDKRPGIGHFPWPKVVDGMYDDVEFPAPRLSDPAIFESQPDHLKKSINRERYYWRWDTPEKYQINIRAYFRMLSSIDHVVGRVMEALEKEGFADNTIIVYSADNGYYLGDRGFAGKWSHYEQSLRVPLIIFDPRQPKATRGRVESAMGVNLDFPSTFLDWAGVEIPGHYQGRSLKEVVRGNVPSDWRKDFFCEHVTLAPHITWEGVRGERYVYARYFDQEPVYEFLHDLKNDPDQLVNLATESGHSEALLKMRRRCDELVEMYGGPLLPLAERATRARGSFKEPAKK